MQAHTPAETASTRVLLLLLLVSVLLGAGALTYKLFIPAAIVKYAVAGVLGGVAALWVFSHPTLGLYAAVFYIYAGIGYYFHVHAGYPVVVIAFVASLYRLFRGDHLRLPSIGFNTSVTVFTVFAVTSILWAHYPMSSFHGMSIWLKSLFLVYLIVHLLRNPRDVERFALIMYIGALASVLLGLANIHFGWVQKERLLEEYGWVRFTATHEDPNAAALILASVTPIGVYALRRYRRWAVRVGFIVGTLLIVLAAFSTLSRAAVFPLLFVVLFVMIRDLGKHSILPIAIVSVLIAVLVPPVYWERLASLEQLFAGVMGDFSLMMRFKAMETAWYFFLAHPLTGIGLENFAMRSMPDVLIRIPAHNAYLDLLSGVGIFGFGAYTAGLGSVFREYLNALRAPGNAHMRHLAFYLLASAGTVLVGALFLSIWHYYILWLPLAAILAAGRVAREAQGDDRDEGTDTPSAG